MLKLHPALNLLADQFCYCRNARFQFTDCMFWLQCNNCGTFLTRMPREGLISHFRAVEHIPPANPLHLRPPLTAHGTKGGSADREEEE